MKTYLTALVLGVTGLLMFGIAPASGDLEVSASVHVNAVADFDAPLVPMGAWVTVNGHGRCWHPTGVAVDWRPYCVGQWEWTDAGWYWTSDEPWAWACYHYGNWFDDPAVGWVWVPGIEWAPAWVTWRVGDAHIGWAPLPPAGMVVAPGLFAFVDVGHFHDHLTRGKVTVKNDALFHETKEAGGRRGPDVAMIEKHGEKVQRYAVRDVDRKTHYPEALSHKATQHAQPARAVEHSPRPAVNPKDTPERQKREVPAPAEPNHSIAPAPREVPAPREAPIPEPHGAPVPAPRGDREKGF